MFERPHHQKIAHILGSLDADRLRSYACYFGGGTAVALRFGEYRESVDMDFLISDPSAYRDLRHLLKGSPDLTPISRATAQPLRLLRDIRADQYGIRTTIQMDGQAIKFEIIREARNELILPKAKDQICSVSRLTTLDLATSKLLANSDHYADDSVFSRDIIDLAMMDLPRLTLQRAIEKALEAYGPSIIQDLNRAILLLQEREGWLDRCMLAMGMRIPKALVWAKIRRLKRILP